MQQGIDEYEPCRDDPANEKRNVRQKLPRDWLHKREVEAMSRLPGATATSSAPSRQSSAQSVARKSAVIVERLVRVQLRAMGCECFDLGIKRDAGR
jgi:hypothetical protein